MVTLVSLRCLIFNNIHEKITQFWLAEKGVQLFRNTSAKCVTRVQTCNTSANYKCFLIGWKHKRNHQEPIRLELFEQQKFKKMAIVFSRRRRDLIWYAKQQSKIKKIFQKPEQGKKYVFLAKCIENALLIEKYCQQKRGKWARGTKKQAFFLSISPLFFIFHKS